MITLLKRFLYATAYRVGTPRTVLFGPCRGLKYHIFEGYSLAYLYGGREREEMQAMIAHIRPGSVVYDLGANYGMHTLLFARLAGPEGRVLAFEPSPGVYQWLQKNIDLNGFQHVTCVQKAVSDANGRVLFDAGSSTATGHISTTSTGFAVEAVTIDSLLESGCPVPDFMKIDVEGGESSALEGALNVLRARRPTLLIELHSPQQDVAVGTILRDLDYKVERLRPREEVERLDLGWPHKNGIWGTVLATARVV
jgi:FkbM family methyltransferase